MMMMDQWVPNLKLLLNNAASLGRSPSLACSQGLIECYMNVKCRKEVRLSVVGVRGLVIIEVQLVILKLVVVNVCTNILFRLWVVCGRPKVFVSVN